MTQHENDNLEHLEQEIAEVRDRVAEEQGENEPLFIQEGAASEDQPVDDTIAPPG
jgi:hypothetical protein